VNTLILLKTCKFQINKNWISQSTATSASQKKPALTDPSNYLLNFTKHDKTIQGSSHLCKKMFRVSLESKDQLCWRHWSRLNTGSNCPPAFTHLWHTALEQELYSIHQAKCLTIKVHKTMVYYLLMHNFTIFSFHFIHTSNMLRQNEVQGSL